MKRLSGVVPLALFFLIFSSSAFGEGKAPSASAGTITEAPAQSAPASAEAAAPSAASSPASSPAVSTPASPAAKVPASAVAAASINWKAGPHDVVLLDQATLKLPPDFAYLEQGDARQMLRKLGNPNVDDVMGLLTGPGGNWLIVLRFNKSGYIKDSEKPNWKLDELLFSLKKNIGQTNAIRHKEGVSETEIVGWVEQPSYDAARHRVVWAVSSRDKGSKETDFQSVNFNMASLGREGYFSINLVTDLKQIEQNKKYASVIAASLTYNENKKYADYKEGKDQVASYSVTGLVGGSEDAAMTKKTELKSAPSESKRSRFLKMFGLILLGVVIVAGVAGGIYYFLQRRRRAKMAGEVAALEGTPPPSAPSAPPAPAAPAKTK